MEFIRDEVSYYDLEARLGSVNRGLTGQQSIIEKEIEQRAGEIADIHSNLSSLNSALIEQSELLADECDTRRDQVKTVRYELGLRIQELEDSVNISHKHLLEEADGKLAEYEEQLSLLRTDISSEASKLESLKALVRENETAIAAEQQQRADQYSALSAISERIEAKADDNTSAIEREAIVRADALRAYAERLTQLETDIDGSYAKLEEISGVVSENEKLSASERRQLIAYIDELSEGLLNLSGTQAFEGDTRRRKLALAREELKAEIHEEKEARAARELELYAQIEDTKALIQEEQEARSAADDAEASSRQTLESKVDSNTALIQEEREARSTSDEAEASARETLESKVVENTSAIDAERTARIAADEAESKTREELAVKVDSNTASIEAVREAVSDAGQVTVDELRSIQAYIGDLSEAEIQDALNEADGQARRRLKLARAEEELTAKIEDGNKASAEYRQELLALMEGQKAEYTRRIKAVSDDLKAEVTSREKLSSQVGSNTSNIITLNELKDGVTARSYLKLDTNGYVSGIESYNGGEKNSSFIVTADKFKIVPPNMTNPQDILEYDSSTGKLKLKNIEADGALIKSGTIGGLKLLDGTITSEKISDNAVVRDKIFDGAVTAVNLVTIDEHGYDLPSYGANTYATCYPPAGEVGGRMLIILSFTLSCPQSASSSRIKAQAVIHLGKYKPKNPDYEIHDIRDMYEFTDPLMEYKEDEYWAGSHTFTFITKWTRTDTSVMPITALIGVYYEDDTAVCNAKQATFAMSVMSLHR